MRATALGLGLAMCLGIPAAAVFAADPLAAAPQAAVIVTPASRPPAARPAAPQPAAAQVFRGAKPAAPAGAPQDKALEQARQLQQLQQFEQARQAAAFANRPTAWQLQNPSGAQNRSPTDFTPNGHLAPNTYFGPQNRTWTGLSAPVAQQQLPPGFVTPPPATQANVPLAPNTYFGADNAAWSNVRWGTGVPNPLGSWTYQSR